MINMINNLKKEMMLIDDKSYEIYSRLAYTITPQVSNAKSTVLL